MKIFVSLVFIVVAAFFGGGYFLVFTIQKHEAQNEMREAIKNGKMMERHQILLFSYKDFEKLKVNDREFLFEGSMHDIMRIEGQGDWIQVTFVTDKKETQLFAGLRNLTEEHPTSGTNTSVPFSITLFKFLQTSFTDDVTNLQLAFQLTRETIISESLMAYTNPDLHLHFPPPKLSC